MRPRLDNRHLSLGALPALLVLVLAAVTALSATGSASAATPCGKKVLADWFDNGRIDHIYPLHCYEDAIDAIPNDIRDYADAQDVITRALQSALRGQLAPGGKDPSPNGKNGRNGAHDGGSNAGGQQAAPTVDSSGPSAVPVPLLVLGGLSLALLAAGGLGYLSRRRQATQSAGDDADDDFDPSS